jgi:hypothetical protein
MFKEIQEKRNLSGCTKVALRFYLDLPTLFCYVLTFILQFEQNVFIATCNMNVTYMYSKKIVSVNKPVVLSLYTSVIVLCNIRRVH